MTLIPLPYLEEADMRSLCRSGCQMRFPRVVVSGPLPEYVALTEPEGYSPVGGYRNGLELVSQNVMDKGVAMYLGFNELASLFAGKSSNRWAQTRELVTAQAGRLVPS